MVSQNSDRITLEHLRRMKAERRKFAMLTAYDYPTAQAAEAARVQSLLIGDSMGNVLLGRESTRDVPLDLMITLGQGVRLGAPRVFLIGDLPYECVRDGRAGVLAGAQRFRDEAGCDAVKLEAGSQHVGLVRALVEAGIVTIAHLGLRPQMVTSREQLRAQARDSEAIRTLVEECRQMVAAGAQMLLLEAVPNEASQAVIEATDVPVVGCGGGPACDGHVVVTYDMLGIGSGRVPRFVPVLADLGKQMEAAMRRYVADIDSGAYPGAEHVYGLKREPAAASATSDS